MAPSDASSAAAAGAGATKTAILGGRYVFLDKASGEGAYGVVYRAVDKAEGGFGTVAVKKIKINNPGEGMPQTALREIAVLQELSHPHIVKLMDVEYKPEDTRLYLVFEWLSMDLRQHMDRLKEMEPPRRLTLATMRRFTQQILRGVEYCHERCILHRDIKPQNLLVDGNGNIKIADFGLARVFTLPMRTYTHEVVTLWYRAPEVLLGIKKYTAAIDVWSVGTVMAEMLMNGPMWPADSEIEQLLKIFKTMGTPTEAHWPGVESLPDWVRGFPSWPVASNGAVLRQRLMWDAKIYMSVEGYYALYGMLTLDPGKRLSAKQLLKSPFFEEEETTSELTGRLVVGAPPEVAVAASASVAATASMAAAAAAAAATAKRGGRKAAEAAVVVDVDEEEGAPPAPAPAPAVAVATTKKRVSKGAAAVAAAAGASEDAAAATKPAPKRSRRSSASGAVP